jgi:hypothetical protein
MRIKSESTFLNLVIRIFFDVVVEGEYLSNKELVTLKEFANRRINRICKCYISSYTMTEVEKDKVLHVIGYILRLLYEIRTHNYRYCSFLGKNILISICILKLRFRVIIRFLRSLKRIGLEYDHKNVKSNNLIIAAELPVHSFNYVKDSNLTCSSFGEYLVKEFGSDFCLLSLDEYVRKSKNNESNLDSSAGIEVLPRTIIYRRHSFKAGLKDFFEILNNCTVKNLFSTYGCLKTIYFIDSLRYKRLLSEVSCQHFYVMPFSDFNYYPHEVSKKFTNVQYSENFIVAPFSLGAIANKFSSPSKEFLSALNLSVLGCGHSSIGFISRYSKIYSGFLRYFFNSTSTEVPILTKDMPLALGFESRFHFDSKKCPHLLIFDNPPETKYDQLARTIAGDVCDSEDFVEKFLTEILEIAIKEGYKVMFKPKYSLSNYSNTNYVSFLDAIKKKYSNDLILLNPYVRLSDLVESCDILLSFPFTSTKTFGDCLCKKSYYYFPEKYYDCFEAYMVSWGSHLISKSGLRNILTNMREKS